MSTTAHDAIDALDVSEATKAATREATARLEAIQRNVTQREWLNITQVLDRTRVEIIEDGGLRLLALGWVKEKHAHGGASWDVLLDMTDDQLLELHGFPTDDGEPVEALPEAGDPWPGDNV